MARPYRIQFEGACYRVQIRGDQGVTLFPKEEDFQRMTQVIGTFVYKHEVVLHAYALLPNELDLVVETPNGNVSNFMQGIQTAYAQYYRRKFKHSGSIMRDRYRCKLLEKAKVLVPVTQSVHLREAFSKIRRTPAQRSKTLAKYAHSSYRAVIGADDVPSFLTVTDTHRAMGSPAKTRPDRYKAACEALAKNGAAELEASVKGTALAVGSDAFIAELKSKHTQYVAGKKPGAWKLYGKKGKGIAKTKVLAACAKSMNVEKAVFFEQRKNVLYRPIASYMLYKHSNMVQEDIADFLKLTSGAAVSLQIRKLLRLMQDDPDLVKLVNKVDKAVQKA